MNETALTLRAFNDLFPDEGTPMHRMHLPLSYGFLTGAA